MARKFGRGEVSKKEAKTKEKIESGEPVKVSWKEAKRYAKSQNRLGR
ncbi:MULTISPECIES: hypothetical protein [Kribbella]|uniref:Uncharacterized protein n=1 Tax=Kribbella karoonensis TaxID=324851 RepID=A0ABN2CWH1_9ACTN